MAWRSIAANRMRSVLTMLGIVIGVGSVILLVAAGKATSGAVEGKLEGLGTNILTVYPGGFNFFAAPGEVDLYMTEFGQWTVEDIGKHSQRLAAEEERLFGDL